MLLIAHRGLMHGPDPERENHPDQIRTCLDAGYHAEIDLRLEDGRWALGHDAPQYDAPPWLFHDSRIWIHAKDHLAAQRLALEDPIPNYFWHQGDDRVLTSMRYWWTQPGKELGPRSIAVMPELHIPLDRLGDCTSWACAGICSDHVLFLRRS